MSRVEWGNDLKTGIDEIDLQHRQLVDLFNQFKEAKQDPHQMRKVIHGLRRYVASHFVFEEALMNDAGYRFARVHKKVHELISKRLAEIHRRFREGQDVTGELNNLLDTWLYSHTKNDDAAYVKTVKNYLGTRPRRSSGGGWLTRALRGSWNWLRGKS